MRIKIIYDDGGQVKVGEKEFEGDNLEVIPDVAFVRVIENNPTGNMPYDKSKYRCIFMVKAERFISAEMLP